MAGNYGAIVVFDAEMSYTLEEHMAPDLDSMIAEYNKTAVPPPAASPKLKKTGSGVRRQAMMTEPTTSLKQSRDKMTGEVLAKLEQKICQYKDDLWWFFKELDMDNSGLITVAKWREAMQSTLNLEIPWQSLQDELARPDAQGVVNYRQFLHRIRNNALAEGLKNVDGAHPQHLGPCTHTQTHAHAHRVSILHRQPPPTTTTPCTLTRSAAYNIRCVNACKEPINDVTNPGAWEKQMVVKVYESILRSDLTLKQTIAEFDPDGDGVVSAWEFRKALQVAQVDIPESQVLTADTTITLHAS